jgi:hypothetical protein
LFKFSERDISYFLEGKKFYKFKYVKTIDDGFLEFNPQINYFLKNFHFEISGKIKIFYKNEYKNFGNLTFTIKNIKGIFLKIFYEPYFFIGPVYIKDEKITYPLEFSLFKISSGMNFFETGIYYYNFYPEFFNYLDGIKYFASFEIKKVDLEFSYLKPFNPLPFKNWTFISLKSGLSLDTYILKILPEIEIRKFLTKEKRDTIHYGRYDYKIDFLLEGKINYEKFKFYPFLIYEQRFLKNPYENDIVEILKEYKKFILGLKLII